MTYSIHCIYSGIRNAHSHLRGANREATVSKPLGNRIERAEIITDIALVMIFCVVASLLLLLSYGILNFGQLSVIGTSVCANVAYSLFATAGAMLTINFIIHLVRQSLYIKDVSERGQTFELPIDLELSGNQDEISETHDHSNSSFNQRDLEFSNVQPEIHRLQAQVIGLQQEIDQREGECTRLRAALTQREQEISLKRSKLQTKTSQLEILQRTETALEEIQTTYRNSMPPRDSQSDELSSHKHKPLPIPSLRERGRTIKSSSQARPLNQESEIISPQNVPFSNEVSQNHPPAPPPPQIFPPRPTQGQTSVVESSPQSDRPLGRSASASRSFFRALPQTPPVKSSPPSEGRTQLLSEIRSQNRRVLRKAERPKTQLFQGTGVASVFNRAIVFMDDRPSLNHVTIDQVKRKFDLPMYKTKIHSALDQFLDYLELKQNDCEKQKNVDSSQNNSTSEDWETYSEEVEDEQEVGVEEPILNNYFKEIVNYIQKSNDNHQMQIRISEVEEQINHLFNQLEIENKRNSAS